ncbi:hypothetical protein B0H34DRAFT_618278, partial [Crassisporium funariophilum]
PCKGQPVVWVPGSVWEMYVYQQHDDPFIGWTPCGYRGSRVIILRSKSCLKTLDTPLEKKQRTCDKCDSLRNSQELKKVMTQASQDLALKARKRAHALELQNFNLRRKADRLKKKVTDYQRMVMLLSQNKIAGVSQILAVAVRNGASPEAICTRLDWAISRTYAPHSGWSDRELDVAFLVKAIGGPRLLYALQKAEAYPSLTTLRRRKVIPEVTPSLEIPSDEEINSNISALLGEKGRKPPKNPKCGQVVMIDGVAIEQGIRFDSSRISALGLCREHSAAVKVTVHEVGDLHNIAKALDEKVCHYGKDGTVLGIAPITDKENYHVVPLVVSPLCKTEKGDKLMKWVKEFLKNWHSNPSGAAIHGEVNVLATDGESSFQKLRFLLCLTKDLDRNSELGKILYQLSGLNRRTGDNGLIGTCDPKHIIKRFATMLRSPTGIQLGDTHITSHNTLRKLELGMPPSEAALLLNPADKQNVPKAVNLIQSLQSSTPSQPAISPSSKEEMENVVLPSHDGRVDGVEFVARILSYFLLPFIDVQMSLSEQIRKLSTFSHLITALYLKHRLSFLTSALYADSQAIVKSILFSLARLQLIDPSMDLFEGTDRLENLFSHARTQDHARNFDILQLCHKLSIGSEIDAVFQRHPDLNQGHLCRNLVNARGVDHINPKSWVGNVRVGDVDLLAEYAAGRNEANHILAERWGEEARVDFEALFNSHPNMDHLQPTGSYVGFTATGEPEIDAQDLDNEPVAGSLIPSQEEDNDLEDTRNKIHHKEHLGLNVESQDLNPTAKKSDSSYLNVNGTRHYIPTLMNTLLGADKERRKLVTTRPLRAQGVSILKALKPDSSLLNSSGNEMDNASASHVKAGDLGGVLLQVNGTICLGIGEALNFCQGASKTNLASIDAEDLDAEGPKSATVAVQILDLIQHGRDNLDSEGGDSELKWRSAQKYIQIQALKDGTIQQGHFVARIPGTHFHLAAPDIEYNGKRKPIWSLKDSDLKPIFENAWSDLSPDSPDIVEKVKRLPKSTGPGLTQLPYLLRNGKPSYLLTKEDLPEQLTIVKLNAKKQVACCLCGKIFLVKDMRNHVGLNLCRWCGREGCLMQLVRSTLKPPTITSNCPYHYKKMGYTRASFPTEQTPCTNIPLNCPICPSDAYGKQPTFWKYNFISHMTDNHLIRTDNGKEVFPPLVPELVVTTRISRLEEEKLEVPQEITKAYRARYLVEDSDPVE